MATGHENGIIHNATIEADDAIIPTIIISIKEPTNDFIA